jgi:TonB family protein
VTDQASPAFPLDDALLAAPRNLWLLGAAGALALHAAAAMMAVHYFRDSSNDLGAPGLVINVELAAPRRAVTDLPVGPDEQAASAAPAVLAQKTVVDHSSLPKAQPTVTDDPDRVVSPENTPKPDDKDPRITAVQAAPSDPSVAAEDTAAPALANAQDASRSTVPAQGTGDTAIRERVTWEKELLAHFNKYKRYPAERTMQAAEVVVSFAVDAAGHITSARVVKGSGDSAFDDAALDMLQRSDPAPPPPAVANGPLAFKLPVIFHVGQSR